MIRLVLHAAGFSATTARRGRMVSHHESSTIYWRRLITPRDSQAAHRTRNSSRVIRFLFCMPSIL
jgi:hypothetical protein